MFVFAIRILPTFFKRFAIAKHITRRKRISHSQSEYITLRLRKISLQSRISEIALLYSVFDTHRRKANELESGFFFFLLFVFG